MTGKGGASGGSPSGSRWRLKTTLPRGPSAGLVHSLAGGPTTGTFVTSPRHEGPTTAPARRLVSRIGQHLAVGVTADSAQIETAGSQRSVVFNPRWQA